jgi:hypothetical protein
MACKQGSIGIVIEPPLADQIKAEKLRDNRSSNTNTVYALIVEALQARLVRREAEGCSHGRHPKSPRPSVARV